MDRGMPVGIVAAIAANEGLISEVIATSSTTSMVIIMAGTSMVQ